MKRKRLNRIAAGVISACAVLPASGQTNASPGPLELPLKLREGDLMISAAVNGSEPLALKLDTGFGITTIHPTRVESLGLTRAGKMTIAGIAGDEQADTYSGAVFDFGRGFTYSPRRVAVLPSEAHRRWRKRDGILGASFFRRFVVEIDCRHNLLRLYEPANFKYDGQGEILLMSFKLDTTIVDATIVPPDLQPIAGRFEIDTGCDGALCLGQEFVMANNLVETNSTSPGDFRRGVGGHAEIREGRLEELRLGNLTVETPSANFFLEGSPAGRGQAGHIGIGALQHFKVILDYQNRRLILED